MTDKQYYKLALELNASKNQGDVVCEECGIVIPYPNDRNVCHVIGKGADIRLYHEIENHFVLCYRHVLQEESHHRKTMRIYPEWQKKRDKLKCI